MSISPLKTAAAAVLSRSHFPSLYAEPLPIKLQLIMPAVQIGTRVVVPFGKRMLTGYVLDIFDQLPPEADVQVEKIKSVSDVLDEGPILTDEIIRLAGGPPITICRLSERC